MATRKKKTATKALANYSEELAKYAQQTADVEAGVAGGGKFITLRGGEFRYQGDAIGTQMAVVILDHVLENVFYDGPFDPDNVQPPACYAFGRDVKSMAPHADAPDKQSDACETCDQNAWGSGRGRGKACSNRRRLAVIPAGDYDNGNFDPYSSETLLGFEDAYLKLPVTSVRAFSTYATRLSQVKKLPPFAVYTLITIEPDDKTQFKLTFEVIGEVDSELIPNVIRRHQESVKLIDFPYAAATEEAPKKTTRKKTTRKKRKF